MMADGRAASAGDGAIQALRQAAITHEPDRYIAATLGPRALQVDLAAIAAFAAELARIPASVSEPMLGSIRLQWWRDALAAGRDGATRSGHPVADAVAAAIARHALDARLIEAMIEARELDLAGGLASDDAGLWAYLDATEGHPFRLALAVTGVSADAAEPIAAAAGRAYGLARGLGRLPMLLHNGGLPLTAERLRAAGVDPASLTDRDTAAAAAAGIRAVAGDLEHAARAALREVRDRIPRLPRGARVAILPVAMVETYFRAQRPGPRLDRMADVSQLARVVRLGSARLTGRI